MIMSNQKEQENFAKEVKAVGAGETLSDQIYEYVKNNIASGVYEKGQLPTEAELAKQFYVSRITTKSAMKRLADEGIIVRIRGKGSFVNDRSVLPLVPAKNAPAGEASSTIALVMGGYTSAFGLDILNGAIREAQRQHVHLLVSTTDNAQSQETEIISSLMASGVRGIIIQPVHGETYSKHLIQAIYSGFPIVMLDRRMQGIDAAFVGVDNRELSRFAVEKLIEQGHQKIALLALPDERSSTIRERMDGFKDACVDHHILVNKDLWLVNMNAMFDQPPELLDAAETYEKYVKRIEEHLRQHPDITAVFGTEYHVSKAAWEALRRMGKSVPADVSLVSFDMDSSYVGSHTMSYIKQPQYDMGKRSVELLMQMIRGEQPANNLCILDGEWIDGGTIAPVRKAE